MPRAKKEEMCNCEDCHCGCCGGHMHGHRKLLIGGLIFLVGLMLYLNYSWPVILMVVGAIVFLKGLIKKFMY
jgi:hypothetical protein